MKGKVRNFFAEGNTAKGFYSFYESSIEGLERLFILKGGPGTGKSSLIRNIGNEFLHKGFDVEFLHCASDNDSLDGVIIPYIKVGIVDGTSPHIIEPKAPGAIEEYINLGSAWDSKKLIPHKTEILDLNRKIFEKFENAYSEFAEALKIHDEWEKIYMSNINFDELNNMAEELIRLFFVDKNLSKKPKVRDMFFGAATPKGPVDFIENLTDNILKRYFIKGRPGSGKSTLLKKLAAAAQDKGFDVEIFHCGFDPDSLDMLIFPELSIAIFDSTSPHEYFPTRDNDEIVDVYKRAITPGTDEKYASELKDIVARYSSKTKKATSYLAEAKNLNDELEKLYISAMNFDKIENIKNEISSKICEMI